MAREWWGQQRVRASVPASPPAGGGRGDGHVHRCDSDGFIDVLCNLIQLSTLTLKYLFLTHTFPPIRFYSYCMIPSKKATNIFLHYTFSIDKKQVFFLFFIPFFTNFSLKKHFIFTHLLIPLFFVLPAFVFERRGSIGILERPYEVTDI